MPVLLMRFWLLWFAAGGAAGGCSAAAVAAAVTAAVCVHAAVAAVLIQPLLWLVLLLRPLALQTLRMLLIRILCEGTAAVAIQVFTCKKAPSAAAAAL